MRTNYPHGMSQENRVHPLFIILRKHSEKEERLFRKLVRTTVWTSVLNVVIIMMVALCFANECALVVFFAIAMALTTIAFMVEQSLNIFKCLTRDWLIFPKVNKMLYTDDYSTAILNYENVVNMIGECQSMQSYLSCKVTDVYRNLIYTIIILGVGILAHFCSGGVF